MDVASVAQLISTVGFPIACCIIMFQALTKEQESHKQEMAAVTAALNNNTVALTKLSDKLGVSITNDN